ncbi:MAG TPA: histidine ammonia-lyase [Flavobacteriales bacterium]|nr:histidine ammonia-lyase [Flavobacteriales bacterium]
MTILENKHYSLDDIGSILSSNEPISLGSDLGASVLKGRAFLEDFIERAEKPIYGINTGFGSLCDVRIDTDQLGQLQENLVKSHACGLGREVDHDIVRTMLLLKVLGLSKGNSGIRMETITMLIELFNRSIIPVVYEQGSLGASGDLAPLAHLALPLLGLGEVWYKGSKCDASSALDAEGLSSISLGAKEGLALLNGTQFMSAHGVKILNGLSHWMPQAEKVAALSLDAYDGRPEPFDDAVHAVRPHDGQRETAARMRSLLEGSDWISQRKDHVQDPYSFRCIPQVHGASKDAIKHIASVFEREVNSVTDNPTLIPEEDKIISAGNFHGQPLALGFDYLCIAVAELASISERRTYKLIGGQRGLPAYLVGKPGLNSGLMIAQYTAASIISQNKQLCTPASVDSIDSSNGQEDHVSMGANAATKALRVYENYQKVIGIELINAAQAADFREGKSSPTLEAFRAEFRSVVPFMEDDIVMSPVMHNAVEFLSA